MRLPLAIRQIPLWRFLLATALVFVSRFFVIGRWHVLLRSAEVNIPSPASAALTFTGLFASNFLPTTIGGDVVRFAGAVEMGYSSTHHPCIAGCRPVDRDGGHGNGTAIGFGCALVHGDGQNCRRRFPWPRCGQKAGIS